MALAALSFLPTITFYYVGEEAIFPISALEMWHRGDWIRQHMYGANLQHNPLFNWLIIPLAVLTGWEYMLQVARIITVAATLATSVVVGWLAFRLLRDATFAWFAALVYLTLADVLLYRGWLAYVDPLYGMFVFGAIAALWVACEERRQALLVVAVVSLTCAFLSKAFTAYVFYGTAVLILLFLPHGRHMLLSRASIALHTAAALTPIMWLALVAANAGQGNRMFAEILGKLMPAGPLEYLLHLTVFPAETLLRLSPALPLALYFAWRRRISVDAGQPSHLKIALWIVALSFLPYWLAPLGAIRYLVPIYPVIALALAMLLWRAEEQALAVTRRWLIGIVVLKLVAVAFLFPYYQSHYRGENYALAARDIIERTAGHPLYVTDVSASGMSVAGYIDAWTYPVPPLHRPPAKWESGFVISYVEDPQLGQTIKHYKLAANELFLLCRGVACQGKP